MRGRHSAGGSLVEIEGQAMGGSGRARGGEGDAGAILSLLG